VSLLNLFTKPKPFRPLLAKSIPENTTGRDFIVGDIHGRYSDLKSLLKQVRFHTKKDRLICVGDLTDRGKENFQCLDLLNKPWFHCVLGNHDEAFALYVLDSLKNVQTPLEDHPYLEELVGFEMQNGGKWLLHATLTAPSLLKAYRLLKAVDNLRTCPRILTVKGANPYHVVHAAAVNPTRLNSENPCLTDTEIEELETKPDLPNPWELTTFRDIATTPNLPTNSPGLATTYCGHTPLKTVTTKLSHVHLDTGVTTLTMIEQKLHTIYQSRWIIPSEPTDSYPQKCPPCPPTSSSKP
jgi:serine/threonine protein phosphatase 1